jgi:hypothetical protein
MFTHPPSRTPGIFTGDVARGAIVSNTFSREGFVPSTSSLARSSSFELAARNVRAKLVRLVVLVSGSGREIKGASAFRCYLG